MGPINLATGQRWPGEALAKFTVALGMSDEKLRASEPIPAAFAYSAFVASLGMYGSDAEFAAAFLVNFAAWGANCGRMSIALRAALPPDWKDQQLLLQR
jgi:hypothetical protein